MTSSCVINYVNPGHFFHVFVTCPIFILGVYYSIRHLKPQINGKNFHEFSYESLNPVAVTKPEPHNARELRTH